MADGKFSMLEYTILIWVNKVKGFSHTLVTFSVVPTAGLDI